jgi:hypothetical protein
VSDELNGFHGRTLTQSMRKAKARAQER